MWDLVAPVLLVPEHGQAQSVAACFEAVRALSASVTIDLRAAVAQAGVGRPVWVCGLADMRIEQEPAGDWLQKRYPRLAVVSIVASDGPGLAQGLRRHGMRGGWHWPRWWPWHMQAPVCLHPVAAGVIARVYGPAGASTEAGSLLLVTRAMTQAGPLTTNAYALTVAAEIDSRYRTGLRMFGLAQAPNTPDGGWGVHWRSAPEHAEWFLALSRRLRGLVPRAEDWVSGPGPCRTWGRFPGAGGLLGSEPERAAHH